MNIGNIPVRIIRSRRTTCTIGVDGRGNAVFRCPEGMSETEIRRLLESRLPWIVKKVEAALRRQTQESGERLTAEEVRALEKRAAADLPPRAAAFAAVIGVTYGRITIRCQKTRWGSCSSRGNLNFNCLLMLCPEEVRDYVVVHELCHRREMNHSAAFWALVGSVIPEHQRYEKWLKENGGALIRRVYG